MMSRCVFRLFVTAFLANAAFIRLTAPCFADELQALAIERPASEVQVDFARDVEPVLRRSCLACHSASKARGDINLESVEAILAGNDDGPIVFAGKSLESRLLRVAAHLEEPAMPPPENKVGAVTLTPAELGRLAAWIDQGAKTSEAETAESIRWNPLPATLEPVYAVAVAADGRTVATGRARRIDLHDIQSGESLRSLVDEALVDGDEPIAPGASQVAPAHRDLVHSLAFHPEGDLLASGGFRVVKFWRRARGERMAEAALAEGARLLAASADGSRFVIALADHALVVLGEDFAELRKLEPRRDESGAVESLLAASIDAAGDRLACLTSKRLEVVSLADGAVLSSEPAPEGAAAIELTADGVKTIAVVEAFVAVSAAGELTATRAANGVVQVLAADGKTLADLRPQDEKATRRAAIARGLADRLTERVEDARRRREEAEKSRGEREKSLTQAVEAETKAREALEAKRAEIETLKKAEPPDAKGIEKAEKEAQEADDALKNASRNVEDARADLARVQETLTARDAELAAATARQAEAAATAQAREEAAVASRAEVAALAFSDSALWIATVDGKAHRFGLPSFEPDETIECGAVRSLRVVADRLLVEGVDRLSLWAERTPYRLLAKIGESSESESFRGRVLSLAFSPDGCCLAAGGGEPSRSGTVSLFDLAPLAADPPGEPALLWRNDTAHSDVVAGLAFSPDGLVLATAGTDKIARLLERETGVERRFFEGHTEHVLGVSFSRDARTLATVGADRTLRVWNVETGESRKTIQGFGKQATAVSFLGDSGETVSASGDRRLRVHRAERGDEVRSYGEIPSYVYALAVAPDGRTVVAGGHDGSLHVWDAREGKQLRVLAPPER